MMNAEDEHLALAFHAVLNRAWAQYVGPMIVPPQMPVEFQAYLAAGMDFLFWVRLYRADLCRSPAVAVATAPDWKDALRKYGRHSPSCPTGGTCTCGFDRVEQELRNGGP